MLQRNAATKRAPLTRPGKVLFQRPMDLFARTAPPTTPSQPLSRSNFTSYLSDTLSNESNYLSGTLGGPTSIHLPPSPSGYYTNLDFYLLLFKLLFGLSVNSVLFGSVFISLRQAFRVSSSRAAPYSSSASGQLYCPVIDQIVAFSSVVAICRLIGRSGLQILCFYGKAM